MIPAAAIIAIIDYDCAPGDRRHAIDTFADMIFADCRRAIAMLPAMPDAADAFADDCAAMILPLPYMLIHYDAAAADYFRL